MDPESKTGVLLRGGGDTQRRGRVRTQAETRETHPVAGKGLGLLDPPEAGRQEGSSPGASEGVRPAHPSTSDFQPADREKMNFCFLMYTTMCGGASPVAQQ